MKLATMEKFDVATINDNWEKIEAFLVWANEILGS